MEVDRSDKIFTTLAGTRKRKYTINKVVNNEDRKLVPVLEKLSADELMENSLYYKFNRSIQSILQNVDNSLIADLISNNQLAVHDNVLVNGRHLQDLCTETSKLKYLGAMKNVSVDRLIQLLNILEINVRGADHISFITDYEKNENVREQREKILDRVMSAADASLCILYIMTSPSMPKRIYLEDCIDKVVLYIKFQLHSVIFPHYDAVYQTNLKKKAHRNKSSFQSCSEQVSALYYKIYELVNLLSELLYIQVMTDTTVLHLSSVVLPTLFSENIPELQLSCLKLITVIFTVYEKHRKLLLDDILASLSTLPNHKHNLRSYQLNCEEEIHILTAIILQFMQCTITLSDNVFTEPNKLVLQKKALKQSNNDSLICNKYEIIINTAGTFLTLFLNKCSNKNEEMVFRPIFEIFLQDLLLIVNKPEWPAAELLVNLLGNLLVKNLSNKDMDISWRIASLDYLGLLTARLRKHTVFSLSKVDNIDQIIKDIKLKETETSDLDFKHNNTEGEEERIRILHRVLLDYLAVNSTKSEVYKYARLFYIVQWYKDATQKMTFIDSGDGDNKNNDSHKNENIKKSNNTRATKRKHSDEANSNKLKRENPNKNNSELYRIIEERKIFYISKIQPFPERISSGNPIEYCNAETISQYLMSKRSFSQSFDGYVRTILLVLNENSNAIRAKAMRCLTMIVEADPSILGQNDVQIAVNHSFLDHSTSVREAAVDLVGKFILTKPELITKYYDMLSTRILDTGVSVRKRVIKIFRDICIEYPEFPKISEICIKLIRRVNDEEGINKLVIETFQNMWFTPIPERPILDKTALLKKVTNIADVVASLKDIGLEWFEKLLVYLFVPKENKEDLTKVQAEPSKTILFACQQITNCIMDNVLESSIIVEEKRASSEQIVAYLITLSLFAKIRPQLLVEHATKLQPFLSLKCQTKEDYLIISSISRILELVVPLMDNSSSSFLAQLEENIIKLIIQHDRTVISSCLSCLSCIVNNITKNFKLIHICFKQHYDHVMKYKNFLENDSEKYKNIIIKCRPIFRRSLFIIGLLLRHFDFTDENVIEGLPVDIKDQVFRVFLYFLRCKDEDIQSNALKAIGFICVRYNDFFLNKDLKTFYHKILIRDDVSQKMKSEVLQNIEMYLTEQENRIIKDQERAKQSKEESLKEMGDISSCMGSAIIQSYLKEILNAYLHPHIAVRHTFLRVIQLILRQGMVHLEHIIPYLICMSTDSEKIIAYNADSQLMEIEKKYPGIIYTKSQLGVLLSYKLQTLIQTGIVRGSRATEQEYPIALNCYLYSLIRASRQQRRALALYMLKQFDEKHTGLPYMLYLADNLAYFPYIVQDEPLFVVHHINIIISETGTNFLQSFREVLMGSEETGKRQTMSNQVEESNSQRFTAASALDDDDEDEDIEELVAKLPSNTTDFQDWMTAAQGCLLLLLLKQHLKNLYGLTDGKISQYTPSAITKVYEKTATRRKNVTFNPNIILNRLKQGASTEILDNKGRKNLIVQYLNFKKLMLKLDLKEQTDDKC